MGRFNPWIALAILLLATSQAVAADVPGVTRAGMVTADGFRLEEFLGRTWHNDVVRFPLEGNSLAHARAGHALRTAEGKAVAYQVIDGAAGTKIAFAADLDPCKTQTYRFDANVANPPTDLAVEQTDAEIRLVNRQVGISIRRRLSPGEGPIAAIRSGGGRWIGGSRLEGVAKGTTYEARVVAKGPVLAEVVCQFDCGSNRRWQIRFTLTAGDPVVTVAEECWLGAGASMELDLSRNFQPEQVLYRHGKAGVGTLATWRIGPDAEPVFVLEPWLRWWERLRQGRWFGLYRAASRDLLAIGACNADRWAGPHATRAAASPPRLIASQGARGVKLELPLATGKRRWMIASVDKQASLALLAGPDLCKAPLPQKHFARHGDFPLDRIKDYIIDWPGDHANHPRLLVTRADLPGLRARFSAVDAARAAEYAKAVVSPYTMEGPVRCYLATGDAALAAHLSETAVEWLQEVVRMYCDQDALISPGFAPHHQTAVLTALNLTDAVLGSDALPPETRRRMRAQIAFIGYTVDREDFWSPARGFSANPNMTTTMAAYKTAAACMIPSHPAAAGWLRHGMAELKDNQLDTWSDSNGGWLEAPHYAMVSYDYLAGCFLMARNAGFGDMLYDEKMKKLVAWFAKISTPPDLRLAGHRHYPPIGNTYICEPTGAFALAAYLWKDRDPKFASEMQWMHRQHGSPDTPGIGGFFPTLAGYRTILRDDAIVAKAPAYASELFPKTGVVLRNTFPSDRETQLHMIAGENHDHYDKDSGSVTLWGKGRIVADDFGYYGYVTGEDHSMLVSPAAPDIEIMRIGEFAPGPRLDYVRGRKLDWTRQVALVKDADPLGPNYFVFRDSLAKPAEATWRLWLTCARVSLGAAGSAVAIGKEDVDTDIVFLKPVGATLQTPTISRTSASGISPDGRQGPTTTSQTGLVATQQSGDGFFVVVFPRLKSQSPPVVTPLADGRGAKVQTSAGTDYVFLSPQRFKFREGDVAFDGAAGAIQVRDKSIHLTLGAAGEIALGGHALAAPAAATKTIAR